MKSKGLTRRGFMAVAAAVVVAPGIPVFKPRSAGLTQIIAEGINPEWDGTFRMSGYVRPQSIYWHGLPPVVKLDLKPWPWER